MAKKPESSGKFSEKAAEGVKKAGKAMKDATAKAASNAATINTKVIDHAEANARSAFAALRSAAGAKSVQDVVKIQTDYVKEQGARSMTQIKEVGDMIAQFGRDAMGAWRTPKGD